MEDILNFHVGDFVDIHTHILPGVDDGCRSLTESIDFARLYEKAGIQQIVATPHFIPGTAWAPDKITVREKVDSLNGHLAEHGVNLRVFTGMEIAYHDNLGPNLEQGMLLPLGNSEFFLIEPPMTKGADLFLADIGGLVEQGYRIILAHPERIEGLQNNLEAVHCLVREGALVQINFHSITGYFGRRAKRASEKLLEMNCCHFLASDSHDLRKRPPISLTELEMLGRFPAVMNALKAGNRKLKELFY